MKFRTILPVLVALGIGTLLFLPADAFAQGMDVAKLNSKCLNTELKDCVVLSSGRLNVRWGEDRGAPIIAWQTQTGFDDYGGTTGGFVLLDYADGAWSMLDSGFDAVVYEPPRLNDEATLLHIPGMSAGTGAFNEDRLYVRDSETAADWQRIDIESWLGAVEPMLPEGLFIGKGVDYDFEDWFYGALNARTPLWRGEDGNCCPTGGWAIVHFDLDLDAKKIVPVRADYIPPTED